MNIQTLKQKRRKGQAGFTLIELMIVVAIIAILAAVAIPNFLRARAKANFTAAVEQLKNIASGMEQEISEQGSLGVAPVGSAEDVCHHILSGYDNAAACNGQVALRFDEIGIPGTLNFNSPDGLFQYEIGGQSNEPKKCNICVSEVGIDPKDYPTCIKNGGACNFMH